MTTNLLIFPTEKEWDKIFLSSPFSKLFSSAEKITKPFNQGDLIIYLHLQSYYDNIHHKLDDTCRGYIFMMYYFNKGISDERWHTSPTKKGEPLEFYPDLSEDDAIIKSWFDFYSDITYYKLFSVWDVLGHVLNITYKMGVKKVDFSRAVQALKTRDKLLHDKLSQIIDATVYQDAIKIRHDITHNLLPNVPGMATHLIEKSPIGKKSYRYGFNKYIPSRSIVENIQETLGLLEKTFEYLPENS